MVYWRFVEGSVPTPVQCETEHSKPVKQETGW